MTMHINDELLERVVRITGAASKTEAVDMALRTLARRSLLADFGRTGLGLSHAELLDSMEPGYDILAMRDVECAGAASSSRVAEDPLPPNRPISYREFSRRRRNSQE